MSVWFVHFFLGGGVTGSGDATSGRRVPTENEPWKARRLHSQQHSQKKKKRKILRAFFFGCEKKKKNMADWASKWAGPPGPIRCTVLFPWAVGRTGRIFPMWLTVMRSHSCTQKTCTCRIDENLPITTHRPRVPSWVDVDWPPILGGH